MGPLVGDLSTGSQKYGLFAGFFQRGPCPAGGGVEKVEKHQNLRFIVFCKCYKTLNGSKKKQKNKRDGDNSTELLEALVGQFIGVGESDVRPRHFQARGLEARGEGRERGNLIGTTSKPPVAQRAGGIYVYICP